MSIYDEMAEKANDIRKFSADDTNWNKEDKYFWYHRVTKDVENKINSAVLSESEVNSARSILRKLVQVHFLNVATRIRKVEAALGKDVISLNGKTFQSELEETAHSVEKIYNDYMEFDKAVGDRLPKVIEFQKNTQVIEYFQTGKLITYK